MAVRHDYPIVNRQAFIPTMASPFHSSSPVVTERWSRRSARRSGLLPAALPVPSADFGVYRLPDTLTEKATGHGGPHPPMRSPEQASRNYVLTKVVRAIRRLSRAQGVGHRDGSSRSFGGGLHLLRRAGLRMHCGTRRKASDAVGRCRHLRPGAPTVGSKRVTLLHPPRVGGGFIGPENLKSHHRVTAWRQDRCIPPP